MTMAPVAPATKKKKPAANLGISKRRDRPLVAREEWEDRALCRQVDPDLMTPGDPKSDSGADPYIPATAKKVCQGFGDGKFRAGCPVRLQCGIRALESREPHGVWGGMCESERARVLALVPEAEWPGFVAMNAEVRRLELDLLQP